MNNYPCVNKLCDIINNSGLCKGTMNGCVLNYYPADSMRSKPHTDNENYVNQKSSICTVSIGGTRTFNIHKQIQQHHVLILPNYYQSINLFEDD